MVKDPAPRGVAPGDGMDPAVAGKVATPKTADPIDAAIDAFFGDEPDSFQGQAKAEPQTREEVVKEAVKETAKAVVKVAVVAAKALAAVAELASPAARSGARAPDLAPATPAAPFSGQSAFVPARQAAPAPAVTQRALMSDDVFQTMGAGAKPAAAKEAPTKERPSKSADPKLNKESGVGTRLGTAGSGDGNQN